jgi:ribonuclease P protein component
MVKYAGLITHFNQNEVDQLFKKSRRIFYGPEATILAAPRSKDFARLLIVISKKCGIAVERHLLRRRLKHIFYQEQLYTKLNHDLIVIAREPLTHYSFEQLHELIMNVVHNIS